MRVIGKLATTNFTSKMNMVPSTNSGGNNRNRTLQGNKNLKKIVVEVPSRKICYQFFQNGHQ
jgi:hypothetical protein